MNAIIREIKYLCNRIKWLAVLLILSLVFSCSNESQKKQEKRIITVSILPQKYFVEKIAGDRFQINVMIPPGASPESY
ncbi:MAG: hypothetical protein JW731_03900, partial [Bacteroidales bacterium]|nr:hypothetical protein [Bacteroidales bacterium]